MKTSILFKSLSLLIIYFVGSFNQTLAQDIITRDSILTIDDLYLDLSPPDLGAFTLLGVSPSIISRPTSPTELTADILSLTSIDGNIPSGIAIEWTPWLTGNGKKSIHDYRNNKLSGLQVTFGTSSDSSSSKFAWGFKWSRVKSDPLLNSDLLKQIIQADKRYYDIKYFPLADSIRVEFLNKVSSFVIELDSAYNLAISITDLTKALTKERGGYFDLDVTSDTSGVFTAAPIPDKEVFIKNLKQKINNSIVTGVTIDDDDSMINKIENLTNEYIQYLTNFHTFDQSQLNYAKTILKEYYKNNWNSWGINIGLGNILESNEKTWQGLTGNTLNTFVSGSIPITKKLNWNPMIQFEDTISPDSAETDLKIISGSRFIFGTNNLRFSIEGTYEYQKVKELDFRDIKRITLGLELKASDGIWFEIATGLIDDSLNLNGTGIISLASAKYAFNKKRRFN